MIEETVSTPPTPTPPPLEITPEPVSPPSPAYVPPKPKSPLGPILIGFFTVIILSALLGFLYFKIKFNPSESVEPSPSPTPSAIASPRAEPSDDPDELETVKASVKPTVKPISAIVPIKSSSPTPSPIPQPTLDIRFGNPSANVKQTIDEGNGDGRVINREYTSIQSGQFDEVASTWSPRVTVCYHIVSNEVVAGKDVKFSMSLDDKVEVEDNLGGYDKLEAGRLYDWCHDVTTSIGKHTARLTLNSDKSLKEANYTNSLARLDWENLADKIAPNFTLGGPYDWTTNGTCFLTLSPSDNVTATSALKVEHQVDSQSWTSLSGGQYCFIGKTGDYHTYKVKITDARGNVNEQNKSFVLY